jgi:hypothetical protein
MRVTVRNDGPSYSVSRLPIRLRCGAVIDTAASTISISVAYERSLAC